MLRILIPTLGGALGGAINAYLCYAKIPVDVAAFKWHIVPAGACHGAILILFSLLLSRYFYSKDIIFRCIGLFLTGYLAGGTSWSAIRTSIDEKITIETLWWIDREGFMDAILEPFQTFGFVAVGLYIYLVVLRQMNHLRWELHMIGCVISAIAGSVWFWANCGFWYLSFLHGIIWGCLVGYTIWVGNKLASKHKRNLDESV